MHASSFLLAITALVLSRVSAQGLGDLSIPSQCAPLCKPWEDTFSTCLQNFDDEPAQAQCICKQDVVDALVQCGMCAIDPSIQLPSGVDRVDSSSVQLSYDSLKEGCDMFGLKLADVDVTTVTYTLPTTTGASQTTPVAPGGPQTTRATTTTTRMPADTSKPATSPATNPAATNTQTSNQGQNGSNTGATSRAAVPCALAFVTSLLSAAAFKFHLLG